MADASTENEIRTLVENWAAAVRVNDIEGAVAHHTNDIVMFDVPLPLQSRGMAEYRKTWELFVASNRGRAGSFELTDLYITANDTVAYCHALLNVLTPRPASRWVCGGARGVAGRARASLLPPDVTLTIGLSCGVRVGMFAGSTGLPSAQEGHSEWGTCAQCD
jgi:ketosteroid isomerase-like protein